MNSKQPLRRSGLGWWLRGCPWLAVALVAGACTKAPPDQPALAGQDVHLTALHTADLHSRIFPYQFAPGQIDKGLGLLPSHGDIAIVGGAARIATVIARERASTDRVIHVDSGDIFEGAPVFNLFTGEAEMRVWTRIGVTAMALGNHEFDKGPVNLELMKSRFGGFPILAANYLFSDPADPTQAKLRNVIAPYTVVNAQGLRIGIIGMGNLSSLNSIIEGGNSLGIRPLETIGALKAAVAVLRPKDDPFKWVDLLVVLSHLGLDEDEAAAQTNQATTASTKCNSDAECGGIGNCVSNLCQQVCMSDGDCVTGTCGNVDPMTMQGHCQGGVVDQNQAAAIDGVDVIFGGHLHIVLNPPKDLIRKDDQGNPTGHTIVCHSGAFAKYVGRLDLVVHVAETGAALGEACKNNGDCASGACAGGACGAPADGCFNGLLDGNETQVDCGGSCQTCPERQRKQGYVKSYTYKLIPIDDSIQEDGDVARMLEPYQLKMNTQLNLTQDFAVIPCSNAQATCPKVQRTDPDGGDSQLGNLVADSMRLRRRVEADFGLTNSLGIRADFESGALNLEEMFNVFPFDNTITTMYLSGHEIGAMLDFVATKSSTRGCKSQAQVAGLWFIMDCGRNVACGPYDASGNLATHCNAQNDSSTGSGWASQSPLDGPPLIGDSCTYDVNGVQSATDPGRCKKIVPSGEYRAAVNDYIAAGGSGFTVLKNNTTKFNTGISLRDALIDYIRQIPKRCTSADNSNIVYDAADLTEPSHQCMQGDSQDVVDLKCGPKHVCGLDPARVGDTRFYCLRHYDFSGLPCLDLDIQSHDGRIGHSQ